MPPKKVKNKTLPTRYKKKKYWTNNRMVNYVNRFTGFGFPGKLRAKLKYVDEVSTGASASIQYFRFSANGMFDPNVSGVGHQPYGFDQFSTVYGKYRVLSSVMKVWHVNNTATTPDRVPCYVAIALDQDVALTFSNVTHMLESDIIGNVRQIGAYHAVAGTSMSLKEHARKKYSAKGYFGKGFDDNDLEGSVTSNPTTQCYYHLMCAPQAGATSQQMYFRVQIEYSVEFTDLQDLSQS